MTTPAPTTMLASAVEALIAIARGDFSVRLPRTFDRSPDDTLSFSVNRCRSWCKKPSARRLSPAPQDDHGGLRMV